MKTLRALALALAALGVFATAAQAAVTPAPALKLLTITAPTHLSPVQSEVQRVTVEAEGGTFALEQQTAKADGYFTSRAFFGPVTEGSNLVQFFFSPVILGQPPFAVGERVTSSAFPAGTTIIGISGTEEEPLLELSNPSTETEFPEMKFDSNVVTNLTVASGEFRVGDEVSAPPVPAGTTVTAVGADTLMLSNYPTQGGTFTLTGSERTTPLAFDAPPAALQAALEALPALGAGSVSVSGGPGGDTDHPYFIAYGGPLTNEDVGQLEADGSDLVGEHAFAHTFTTVPGGNGTGEIYLFPANIGGVPSSGTITAHLGPLPEGIVMTGTPEGGSGANWNCSGGAGDSEFTCTTSESMRSLHSAPTSLKVPIEVRANAPESATVPAELSGGGSLQPSSYPLPIVVSKKPAPFGMDAIWAGSFEADGTPSTQAGGHPFTGAAYFMVNTRRTAMGKITPSGDSKNVIVDLPPGFVGNPLATARCPQSTPLEPDSGSELCNEEMSVGNLDPYIATLKESLGFESHLYNDIPAQGYAAEFTTRLLFPLQSVLATINSEKDYGVRLLAPNNANLKKIYGAFTAFEGVPKLGNGQALLTNPVNCAESRQKPPVVIGRANTYQDQDTFSEAVVVTQPPLEGCEKLKFEAKDPKTGKGQVGFSFQPTSTQGSSPVGATAHLHIDQGGLTDPDRLVTPELKKAVVKLPEGLSLNASAANGLQACSEAQIGYRGSGFPMPNPIRFNEAQPRCPDGSKLGTAEIKTPVLESPLVGEIFLAAPYANPFGSLLAIYLVVNDPLTGVIIKLPGKIDVAPGGQLTATFDHNPQLPFEDLTLHFRGGGPHSQLATPEVCGRYETKGSWTPWSAPESGPPAKTTHGFNVAGNCASSPATRPFAPSFEAGTTSPLAGGYSPLVLKIGRGDGEQELQSLAFKMPPGFSGRLAGIPYCPEGGIAAARAKSGKAEQATPSCAPASRLGSISATAGVGSDPFRVGGSLYLSGPYKGAPLSAVVITPAVAGPFDLGNVVIRSALRINPDTAQVSAASDPIPTALQNIPLKVRQVLVNIDRPSFTLNPTSCEAMQVSAQIGSSDGASARPHNRFQVGGCRQLSFEPKTYFRLYGGTGRGGHPKVRAIYMTKPGEANLAKGSFTIPRSEFLDQAHIRTVCTRVQFAARACPKGAIYGHVKAYSPIVDYPVSGPVYLRSSDNELPDLVFDLHGPAYQPVHIVVPLRIDSIRGQIRATAENPPDLPVSKLIFFQQGGKKGLLINSRNICKRRYRATVKTEGHNGKRSTFKPVLSNSRCGKGRKAKRGHKHHRLRRLRADR